MRDNVIMQYTSNGTHLNCERTNSQHLKKSVFPITTSILVSVSELIEDQQRANMRLGSQTFLLFEMKSRIPKQIASFAGKSVNTQNSHQSSQQPNFASQIAKILINEKSDLSTIQRCLRARYTSILIQLIQIANIPMYIQLHSLANFHITNQTIPSL